MFMNPSVDYFARNDKRKRGVSSIVSPNLFTADGANYPHTSADEFSHRCTYEVSDLKGSRERNGEKKSLINFAETVALSL